MFLDAIRNSRRWSSFFFLKSFLELSNYKFLGEKNRELLEMLLATYLMFAFISFKMFNFFLEFSNVFLLS